LGYGKRRGRDKFGTRRESQFLRARKGLGEEHQSRRRALKGREGTMASRRMGSDNKIRRPGAKRITPNTPKWEITYNRTQGGGQGQRPVTSLEKTGISCKKTTASSVQNPRPGRRSSGRSRPYREKVRGTDTSTARKGGQPIAQGTPSNRDPKSRTITVLELLKL